MKRWIAIRIARIGDWLVDAALRMDRDMTDWHSYRSNCPCSLCASRKRVHKLTRWAY